MSAADLGRPRWRGQRGRTEVWYLTASDAGTGLGVWVHHETVAPTGDDAPSAHGWAAVFDGRGGPVVERFGPVAVAPGTAGDDTDGAWHAVAGCEVGDGWARGRSGRLAWDLRLDGGGPPLFTFPRAVWERELLPGAQIVPVPDATAHGTVTIDDTPVEVHGRGALARIYGHGSAQRWGWLHADLDGDGVLEIVTATARRPALRRLPPLAVVRLRLHGESDWPARPLLAAPRLRTVLRSDGFDVRGRVRGRRLTVHVELPARDRVVLGYVDPDGSTATCTNSERATATVGVEDAGGTRRWQLDGVAHAEVGSRP